MTQQEVTTSLWLEGQVEEALPGGQGRWELKPPATEEIEMSAQRKARNAPSSFPCPSALPVPPSKLVPCDNAEQS